MGELTVRWTGDSADDGVRDSDEDYQ